MYTLQLYPSPGASPTTFRISPARYNILRGGLVVNTAKLSVSLYITQLSSSLFIFLRHPLYPPLRTLLTRYAIFRGGLVVSHRVFDCIYNKYLLLYMTPFSPEIPTTHLTMKSTNKVQCFNGWLGSISKGCLTVFMF